MFFYSAIATGALAILLSVSTTDAYVERGLAWATDSRYAKLLGDKPLITWYHHWQDARLSEMPAKNEYVPMYWGPKYNSLWDTRVKQMKTNQPQHILGMNEPDVSGQANLSPSKAAQLWMDKLDSWGKKGVKLGSPAIAWDQNWMADFLKALKSKGGHTDFMTIHWYGSHKDIAGFKKYVTSVHTRFGQDIWITELGLTTSSKPSAAQAKAFMMNAFSWMDTQTYVKRASWFGCFIQSNPPDNYATGLNALFKTTGHISDMGYWYVYSHTPDRRSLNIRSRHHQIAARNATEDDGDDNDDGVHCDHICEARQAQIAEWESSQPLSRDEEA